VPPLIKPGDLCPYDSDVLLPECPKCKPVERDWLAERLELDGEVDLQILVDEKGRVTHAEVRDVRAPRMRAQLRASAVEAARRRRYEPARWRGIPCKAQILITVVYVHD